MTSLLSQLALVGTMAATGAFGGHIPEGSAPQPPELSWSRQVEMNSEGNTPAPTTIAQSLGEMLTTNANNLTEVAGATHTGVSRQAAHGVDISSHNRNINLREVMNDGQDFAYVKATESTWYINPYFRDTVVDLISMKKPVGFYHYARPTDNPDEAREEARFFIATTGLDKGVKSLPPVLDLEESEGLSPEQLQEWTAAFVDEFDKLVHRDIMIYTYPNFWRGSMGNTDKFSDLPLWLAHYKTDSNIDIPGGWDTWDFWQYSSNGVLQGSPGDIDVNVFNGTADELRELYISTTNPDGQAPQAPSLNE